MNRRGFLGILASIPAAPLVAPLSTPNIDPRLQISWSQDGGATWLEFSPLPQSIKQKILVKLMPLRRTGPCHMTRFNSSEASPGDKAAIAQQPPAMSVAADNLAVRA